MSCLRCCGTCVVLVLKLVNVGVYSRWVDVDFDPLVVAGVADIYACKVSMRGSCWCFQCSSCILLSPLPSRVRASFSTTAAERSSRCDFVFSEP